VAPLRAATHATLFGLLAATGMRIGEAVAMRRNDVDLDIGVITIRHAKLDQARLVPLHPSTIVALRDYATQRDNLCPAPQADTFFVSTASTALDRSSVGKTFRMITTSAGIRTTEIHPRIHDLRHSFAMRTLLGWQRSGAAVDERIAVLSTYLGHIAPADTYWYLEASPQLMALAADRLDTSSGAAR